MFAQIEDIEIAGETCEIQIDVYEPADAGFFVGHPDRWEPAQPPVIAYTVIEPSTGLPWPELQAKLTNQQEARIENLIIDRITKHLEAVTN